jgi:hypothetical protein
VRNDHSWMYRDSPQILQGMDYYNGVQSFINHAISNPRNISRGNIRFPYKRCKNKKFLDPGVVTMYFLQKDSCSNTCVRTWKIICSSLNHDREDDCVNF